MQSTGEVITSAPNLPDYLLLVFFYYITSIETLDNLHMYVTSICIYIYINNHITPV